ncbi:hypothetical protein PN498_17090 [Oscillatoria sp. CS-180]|uniref:hypothetical protein n=1 Tax=Oscillatoria sp. CS-180 TaxID=3021720 RepID=UPI00232CE95C|nr:hypothetical protein [Oscillatoria sp. CS-180]MDB9527713.1 hypothetical protein [Oscillatoria sp. CS-180]
MAFIDFGFRLKHRQLLVFASISCLLTIAYSLFANPAISNMASPERFGDLTSEPLVVQKSPESTENW